MLYAFAQILTFEEQIRYGEDAPHHVVHACWDFGKLLKLVVKLSYLTGDYIVCTIFVDSDESTRPW